MSAKFHARIDAIINVPPLFGQYISIDPSVLELPSLCTPGSSFLLYFEVRAPNDFNVCLSTRKDCRGIEFRYLNDTQREGVGRPVNSVSSPGFAKASGSTSQDVFWEVCIGNYSNQKSVLRRNGTHMAVVSRSALISNEPSGTAPPAGFLDNSRFTPHWIYVGRSSAIGPLTSALVIRVGSSAQVLPHTAYLHWSESLTSSLSSEGALPPGLPLDGQFYLALGSWDAAISIRGLRVYGAVTSVKPLLSLMAKCHYQQTSELPELRSATPSCLKDPQFPPIIPAEAFEGDALLSGPILDLVTVADAIDVSTEHRVINLATPCFSRKAGYDFVVLDFVRRGDEWYIAAPRTGSDLCARLEQWVNDSSGELVLPSHIEEFKVCGVAFVRAQDIHPGARTMRNITPCVSAEWHMVSVSLPVMFAALLCAERPNSVLAMSSLTEPSLSESLPRNQRDSFAIYSSFVTAPAERTSSVSVIAPVHRISIGDGASATVPVAPFVVVFDLPQSRSEFGRIAHSGRVNGRNYGGPVVSIRLTASESSVDASHPKRELASRSVDLYALPTCYASFLEVHGEVSSDNASCGSVSLSCSLLGLSFCSIIIDSASSVALSALIAAFYLQSDVEIVSAFDAALSAEQNVFSRSPGVYSPALCGSLEKDIPPSVVEGGTFKGLACTCCAQHSRGPAAIASLVDTVAAVFLLQLVEKCSGVLTDNVRAVVRRILSRKAALEPEAAVAVVSTIPSALYRGRFLLPRIAIDQVASNILSSLVPGKVQAFLSLPLPMIFSVLTSPCLQFSASSSSVEPSPALGRAAGTLFVTSGVVISRGFIERLRVAVSNRTSAPELLSLTLESLLERFAMHRHSGPLASIHSLASSFLSQIHTLVGPLGAIATSSDANTAPCGGTLLLSKLISAPRAPLRSMVSGARGSSLLSQVLFAEDGKSLSEDGAKGSCLCSPSIHPLFLTFSIGAIPAEMIAILRFAAHEIINGDASNLNGCVIRLLLLEVKDRRCPRCCTVAVWLLVLCLWAISCPHLYEALFQSCGYGGVTSSCGMNATRRGGLCAVYSIATSSAGGSSGVSTIDLSSTTSSHTAALAAAASGTQLPWPIEAPARPSRGGHWVSGDSTASLPSFGGSADADQHELSSRCSSADDLGRVKDTKLTAQSSQVNLQNSFHCATAGDSLATLPGSVSEEDLEAPEAGDRERAVVSSEVIAVDTPASVVSSVGGRGALYHLGTSMGRRYWRLVAPKVAPPIICPCKGSTVHCITSSSTCNPVSKAYALADRRAYHPGVQFVAAASSSVVESGSLQQPQQCVPWILVSLGSAMRLVPAAYSVRFGDSIPENGIHWMLEAACERRSCRTSPVYSWCIDTPDGLVHTNGPCGTAVVPPPSSLSVSTVIEASCTPTEFASPIGGSASSSPSRFRGNQCVMHWHVLSIVHDTMLRPSGSGAVFPCDLLHPNSSLSFALFRLRALVPGTGTVLAISSFDLYGTVHHLAP